MIVQRRHHDDWDTRGDGIGLEYFGQLVSIHARHQDVEQDQVRRLLRNRGQRLFATGDANREVAFGQQQRFEQFAVMDFVVDDEDGRSGAGHGGR